MFDLNNLYSDSKMQGDNPLCEGCTILSKNKPCHSHMDYEELRESPVLFLSDSLSYKHGSTVAFMPQSLKLIKESYSEDFVTAASVKCPDVREADMTSNDMKICRVHLEATIDKVKPKLVFPCGNMAMKMLIKKSGITSKRGKAYQYTTENGNTCTVVPLFHPYACIKEPAHLPLFQRDIQNAYEKYILGKKTEGNVNYSVLMNLEEVFALSSKLINYTDDLAVDLETTGLNFLTDKIMTISISCREETWVIPVDHKDSPFKKGEVLNSKWLSLRDFLRIIMRSPARKVFHNAKFDLKFLLNYGIKVTNPWDTKVMHHQLDENMPGSLMDLVKLYFAGELESL